MKKTELINQIHKQSNLPKSEVKLVIDSLETSLITHLPREDKIKLSIGYFYKTISGHARFSPSPKFTEKVKESAKALVTAKPESVESNAIDPKGHRIEDSIAPESVEKPTKEIKKNALRNKK